MAGGRRGPRRGRRLPCPTPLCRQTPEGHDRYLQSGHRARTHEPAWLSSPKLRYSRCLKVCRTLFSIALLFFGQSEMTVVDTFFTPRRAGRILAPIFAPVHTGSLTEYVRR